MKIARWLPPPRARVPKVVRTTWVSAHLLDQTADLLREVGDARERHEGVVYWAGRRSGKENFITTCIAPSARTTYGSFETSSTVNARVVMYLASVGLELLGQVHSHPGRLVDHSEGDDAGALMPYDGFLSVVVPEYARLGLRPLTTCGVHLFERARFWRLADFVVEKCFRVVEDVADLRT